MRVIPFVTKAWTWQNAWYARPKWRLWWTNGSCVVHTYSLPRSRKWDRNRTHGRFLGPNSRALLNGRVSPVFAVSSPLWEADSRLLPRLGSPLHISVRTKAEKRREWRREEWGMHTRHSAFKTFFLFPFCVWCNANREITKEISKTWSWSHQIQSHSAIVMHCVTYVQQMNTIRSTLGHYHCNVSILLKGVSLPACTWLVMTTQARPNAEDHIKAASR